MVRNPKPVAAMSHLQFWAHVVDASDYDENGSRFLSFTPPVLRTWILASIRDILDWKVAWPLISPWLQISSDSHVMQKVFSAGIHSQEFHGTQDVFNGIVFTVALMWTDLEDPPPLTLEYLEGGKARNFWEIFLLTTRNITPPHMFFGLPKEVGGVLRSLEFNQDLERPL